MGPQNNPTSDTSELQAWHTEIGRSERQISIFNDTLSEVRDYLHNREYLDSKGDDSVICTGRLLSFVRRLFGYQAVVAFLCARSSSEVMFSEFEQTNNESDIIERLRACKYISTEQLQDLKYADLRRIGIQEYFDEGVVLSVNTLPLAREDDSWLTFYLFNSRFKRGAGDNGDGNATITDTFENNWLAILCDLWFSAFLTNVQKYRDGLGEFRKGPTDRASMEELFRKATLVHPWLRCSDICSLCETSLEQIDMTVEEERKDKIAQLRESIRSFGAKWHCCLDRPWPCDHGMGFAKDELGLLSWYLWRLVERSEDIGGNDYLKDAFVFTQRHIISSLKRPLLDKSLNRYLNRYFLLKLTEHRDVICSCIEHNGPDNTRKNKDYFGQFMAERLSDAPYHPESVESMIWTMGEYTYSVLGIDRRYHIASHLRHAARGEPSLHMMKDFYRDHFFHTIEVCLLGQLLADARPAGLGERRAQKKTLLQKVSDPMRKWYLTALLHDIGYAVDVCDSLKDWLEFFTSDAFCALRKQIEKVLKGEQAQSSGECVKTIVDDFQKFYEGMQFDREIDKPFKDHGLMGAFHLRTLVSSIQRASEMEMPAEEINAIAKHNCQRIKIDYAAEPISALLALCDTLQCWWRPQFPHFSLGPAWMMSAMDRNTRAIDPPRTTSARLMTNIEFVEKKDVLVPQFRGSLVLRLVFDETVNRDSFVFNIWLDALCNLQRVDFSSLPFNILVQIQTPTYLPRKEKGKVKQMDRLRDAARDTHMAYLEPFLGYTNPDVEQTAIASVPVNGDISGFCPDRAISYYVRYGTDNNDKPLRDRPECELLSFSLKEMDGDRQFFQDSISRFRKDLRRWKRYHDDRLLVGDYSPWQHGA
jgi:hypothetical protein